MKENLTEKDRVKFLGSIKHALHEAIDEHGCDRSKVLYVSHIVEHSP